MNHWLVPMISQTRNPLWHSMAQALQTTSACEFVAVINQQPYIEYSVTNKKSVDVLLVVLCSKLPTIEQKQRYYSLKSCILRFVSDSKPLSKALGFRARYKIGCSLLKGLARAVLKRAGSMSGYQEISLLCSGLLMDFAHIFVRLPQISSIFVIYHIGSQVMTFQGSCSIIE